MALFSRRPKKSDPEPPAPVAAAPADDVADGEPAPEVAASVGISVTSFQGLGTQTPTPTPAATPTPPSPPVVETVPGLRDNVVLRESLARLPENPPPSELLNLARNVLQGHLFLRVKGDARALLAEGKALPLAVAAIGERRFALAYSSGAALTASIRGDGDTSTSAMGQPAITVLQHVRDGGLEGLIIDPASAPARAILPKALIERMLVDADEKLAIKTLLAGERTDATSGAVVDAMSSAPMWVAVNTPADGAAPGIAQARGSDGSRFLEVYTHPLEVVAMGREDRPAPVTAAQLAKALTGDAELAGVLIDPQGPWIRLNRDELAPVLALA